MEFYHLFERLGLALAIGFLAGVERGWKKRHSEEETRAAGIRTYSLIGLLGGVAGLIGGSLGPSAFAAIALVFGIAWLCFKLWETWLDQDVSATGAVAGILVFALGTLAAVGNMALAAGAAVAAVSLLAFKDATHAWLRKLTFEEIRSALIILAATLIALPLLPAKPIDPYGAFNPRELWLLALMIASASFAGYIALRTLGSNSGLYVGAAIGAAVSSTAVTLDLARRTKLDQAPALQSATGAVIANAIMFVRVGIMTSIFANHALGAAAPALTIAALTSLAFAGGLRWFTRRAGISRGVVEIGSPLDLVAVGRFALILAIITVAARVVLHFHASESLFLVSAVGGLADVDAVVLALGGLQTSSLAAPAVAGAILIAVLADTILKVAIASFSGSRAFAAPFAAASAISLLAGFVVYGLTRL